MTIEVQERVAQRARARVILGAYLDGLAAGASRIGLAPRPGPVTASDAADGATTERALGRLSALAGRLGLCAPPGTGDRDCSVSPAPVGRTQAACDIGLLVGLAHPCDPMDALVASADALRRLDVLGSGDLATVLAVAAAVSAGVEDSTFEQRLALAAWGADSGSDLAEYRPGPLLSARLTWACALASRAESDPVDVIALLVGNSDVPQECLAAAFAIAATHADPAGAIRAAAALGGQADVIASLAGVVAAGGRRPSGDPDERGTTLAGDSATALDALLAGVLACRETHVAGASGEPAGQSPT